MAHEKKYTAKEAAFAVLKKTQELLEKSELAKAEKLAKDGSTLGNDINAAIKQARGGDSGPPPPPPANVANSISGAFKSEPIGEMRPKEKEQAPKDDTEVNPEWSSDPQTQGTLKLAKFIGHMESKRKAKTAPAGPAEMDKAETGHEKGINTASNPLNPRSVSLAGREARSATKWAQDKKAGIGSTKVTGALAKEHKAAAKDAHKQVLGEMNSMPKPKLPV